MGRRQRVTKKTRRSMRETNEQGKKRDKRQINTYTKFKKTIFTFRPTKMGKVIY
jgi:hypothetical protein